MLGGRWLHLEEFPAYKEVAVRGLRAYPVQQLLDADGLGSRASG